jgi:hypothetical protein
MAGRLYIIGNGFDLHHGIPSAYREFARFLRNTDPTIYRLVDEYFSVDDAFWADFEMRLADFDADSAVDYASQFLDDEGHGDFQYELEKIGAGLSIGLRTRFAEWIRGLQIPSPSGISRPLFIDPSATFLSFNYTATLERTYLVPRSNILHIHGYAGDPADSLILGHGWERKPEDSLNFEPVGPDDDWRVRDGIEHLDDFFAATFKPTAKLIEQNAPFFDKLSAVDHVMVMGHGLAEVDEAYIEAVMERLDLAATRWMISVFGDLQERQVRFGAYGLPPDLVRYLPLDKFD